MKLEGSWRDPLRESLISYDSDVLHSLQAFSSNGSRFIIQIINDDSVAEKMSDRS